MNMRREINPKVSFVWHEIYYSQIPPTHSFHSKIFTKDLLWAGHGARYWRCSCKQVRLGPCSHESYNLVGRNKKQWSQSNNYDNCSEGYNQQSSIGNTCWVNAAFNRLGQGHFLESDWPDGRTQLCEELEMEHSKQAGSQVQRPGSNDFLEERKEWGGRSREEQNNLGLSNSRVACVICKAAKD